MPTKSALTSCTLYQSIIHVTAQRHITFPSKKTQPETRPRKCTAAVRCNSISSSLLSMYLFVNLLRSLQCKQISIDIKGISTYTQTKKKRPLFMVLNLSIQLRCCNKNKTKMLINLRHTKNSTYLVFSSDLEGLLNLMCTQLFPLSSEGNHQNVTHFTLNGNQKRLTIKNI